MTEQNNAALDLGTSSGGRAYIAEYFATQLRRHDFARYINSTLAADFACALAQHLSKLRAEGDERAAVDSCGFVAVKRSAVDWLKDKFPLLTIKAGLCERIGGRLYTITRLMADHDAALASTLAFKGQNPRFIRLPESLKATVAALASAPVDPEIAEVDFLVRVLDNLDTWRAEDWNELLERRPAILALLRPMVRASAPVAGEAQPVAWRAVWTLPTPGATAWCDARKAAPPDETELLAKGYSLELAYAAPQASEAVRVQQLEAARNGAIEEVITLLENHITVSHFEFCDSPEGPTNLIVSRSGQEVMTEAIAAIRALKTQADKDGGKELPTSSWEADWEKFIAWHMRQFGVFDPTNPEHNGHRISWQAGVKSKERQ
ncbi:hypothetical protein [Achromobacter kerstersii]|uniref:Uncharacterized protein n=1 Tax=Achromobacter kerstersii TaxID=1353890 RepID=A0A6S6ZMA1_9BURK|nr:hypothetical protein [Achromobacter kerstersii]CAB3681330.1 hypothetical protein LMG3441_01612 [Achromobacter kerstersii]